MPGGYRRGAQRENVERGMIFEPMRLLYGLIILAALWYVIPTVIALAHVLHERALA